MDNRITLFKANNGSYNEFENSNLELIALERKRKEILVGKIHKNKITKPIGTCKSFASLNTIGQASDLEVETNTSAALR